MSLLFFFLVLLSLSVHFCSGGRHLVDSGSLSQKDLVAVPPMPRQPFDDEDDIRAMKLKELETVSKGVVKKRKSKTFTAGSDTTSTVHQDHPGFHIDYEAPHLHPPSHN